MAIVFCSQAPKTPFFDVFLFKNPSKEKIFIDDTNIHKNPMCCKHNKAYKA